MKSRSIYRGTLWALVSVILLACRGGSVPPAPSFDAPSSTQRPPVTEADRRLLAELQRKAENGFSKRGELSALGAIVRLRTRLQGENHWATRESKVRYDVRASLWERSENAHQANQVGDRLLDEAHGERRIRNDARAERLLRDALAVRQRLFGVDHSWTLAVVDRLAACLLDRGRPDETEELLRWAWRNNEQTLGAFHPRTASNDYRLALCLRLQGKYEDAHAYAVRAVNAFERLATTKEPLTVETYLEEIDIARLRYESLLELGEIETKLVRESEAPEQVLQRVARAEYHLRQGIELMERGAAWKTTELVQRVLQRPAGHPVGRVRDDLARLHIPSPYASTSALVSLAENSYLQGRYHEAYAYYFAAHFLQSHSSGLGPKHPATLRSTHAIGVTLAALKKHEAAQEYLVRAYRLGCEHFRTGHPAVVAFGVSLAKNWCVLGEPARAEEVVRACAEVFEVARLRSAVPGYQRSILLGRQSPYPLLACLLAKSNRPRQAWEKLEANLGRGLLDDLAMRAWLPAEQRERESQLLRRLANIERRLERAPDDVTLRHQYEQTSLELNAFEQRLQAQNLPMSRTDSLAEIQASLEADEALLTWIDSPLQDSSPAGSEHWACLVRKQADPVWFALTGTGAGGAWTEADGRLARDVFAQIGRRPEVVTEEWRPTARRLFRQRLAAVCDHLQRERTPTRVRRLIVLPSTAMAGIPIAPLLASAERASAVQVTYAPSGTLLAWLRQRKAERRRSKPSTARVLLMGNPAFSSAKRLEGSGREVNAIAATIAPDGYELYTGSEASADTLRELAKKDRLAHFTFLHFATHANANPRRPMLSHLVLAGPNGDAELSAMQIMTAWKLDAELVVLSACESGLGRRAGGEGYIGFSQALFFAGAQTVVLSSWKVDDRATSLLMTRFHQNVVGRRPGFTKPMAKADALREAQHWLRALSRQQVDRELARLPAASRSTVGPPLPLGDSPNPFAHPHFWAGFRLIGDPGESLVVPPAPGGHGGATSYAWLKWMGGIIGLLAVAIGWTVYRRRRVK